MYKTVYDFTREELNELKEAYFYDEEIKEPIMYNHWLTGELVPVLFAGDIPDDIIFEHYKDVSFVDDDFFCNQKGE